MKKRQVLALLLASVMSMSLAFPISTFAADTEFAESMETKFAEPEMKNRPYARWWLAEGSHTDETLRESVKELYDEGFGGVEFEPLQVRQNFWMMQPMVGVLRNGSMIQK